MNESPIFAPCRTRCRAAFRRVAGGALVVSGRGEAAVARDARPYHGGLQRFERMGVEEEVDKTDVGDAAVVVGPGLEGVVGYHHLFDSLVKTNMKMSIAGAAPIHYQGWQHSKQIGVCPSIGEREDEFAVCGVEVEKHPVVFDVAVAKPFKVAGKRMILALGGRTSPFASIRTTALSLFSSLPRRSIFFRFFRNRFALKTLYFMRAETP